MKEGSRSSAGKGTGAADDDNDDLHVYISGEKEEDVSACVRACFACCEEGRGGRVDVGV